MSALMDPAAPMTHDEILAVLEQFWDIVDMANDFDGYPVLDADWQPVLREREALVAKGRTALEEVRRLLARVRAAEDLTAYAAHNRFADCGFARCECGYAEALAAWCAAKEAT